MIKTTCNLVAPAPVVGETLGAYLARLAEGDYAFVRHVAKRLEVRYGPLLPTATLAWRAERTRLFEVQLLRDLLQDTCVRETFGPEIQDARRQVQSSVWSAFSING